ncbi:GNAT family N-acetyltransferase [Candidatus Bathyarchaeota archaeon]|nr:MAG: GNAT family N-acetyltransferase [Candidatus Bathyarchaeota archaeon]
MRVTRRRYSGGTRSECSACDGPRGCRDCRCPQEEEGGLRMDTSVGLVMLKTLAEGVGYVYYIAVAEAIRKRGIGKLLIEDALRRFRALGLKEVFASVEEDNESSEALFASEGFTRTSFGEVSKKHGSIHTLNMYREMLVVPGEVLLRKAIL